MQSDFETYCGLDIGKVGHYRYIRDKTFEPLLLAVAFDDEEPFIIDLASGEDVPDIVWAAVFDDGITKTAWHASFERTVFGVMAGMVLPPDMGGVIIPAIGAEKRGGCPPHRRAEGQGRRGADPQVLSSPEADKEQPIHKGDAL